MVEKLLYESVGAVHLHSIASDGSLSIPEIASIAGSKNLDFIMFTDHNTLRPKQDGLEGWYDDVLVLIGYEINDKNDKNHYLAFKLNQEVRGRVAAEYVANVKKAGGFGIIAHPAEKRSFSDAYPPYPWTDWDVEGFDGIEIWNQLSEWMEGVTWANIPWRIWHPLRSIRFPEWDILQRWDALNLKRRVVGIGGIDVHAFTIKVLGLIPVQIYPYKVQFKSIRTHILTEEPVEKQTSDQLAMKAVYGALQSGCCFVSNYSLGEARGFRFHALKGDEYYPMGSRIPFDAGIQFQVEVPGKGEVRLLHNSKVIKKGWTAELNYTAQLSGVYRVEVFRKSKGWIYSNPIVLENKDR